MLVFQTLSFKIISAEEEEEEEEEDDDDGEEILNNGSFEIKTWKCRFAYKVLRIVSIQDYIVKH